jgi:transcription elongation factor GreA
MAKISVINKHAKKVYLTPQGLEDAKSELNFLLGTKRAQVAERIQRARDFGDVTENAEYDAALEEQTVVENRIAYLEDVLGNAQIIDEKPSSDFVVIGSTVKVEMDGEIDEFTIVGKMEADPRKKKISNESPVGSALLGAKIGEQVDVATPIVRYKVKILQIK